MSNLYFEYNSHIDEIEHYNKCTLCDAELHNDCYGHLLTNPSSNENDIISSTSSCPGCSNRRRR